MITRREGSSILRQKGEEDNGFPLRTGAGPMGLDSADLGLLIMALIWGVNFPLIKATLSEIEPLAFNALRFPLAAFTVFLVLRLRGKIPWPARKDWHKVLALGVVGNVFYQGFFIFGLDSTLAGNASILLATTPVWTLAFSTLLRHERPGPLVWGGVTATLVGMVLVVLGGRLGVALRATTFRGDLLIVGAAVTWSAYSVGSRRMIQRYGSLKVTAWTLWVGTAGLFLLGLPSLLRTPLEEPSPLAWGGVLYSGVFAIGVAYLLWYRGVQRIGNARTAAFSNLTPVVALCVAWGWLGEVPTIPQVGGAVVVLSGLWLARTGRERD